MIFFFEEATKSQAFSPPSQAERSQAGYWKQRRHRLRWLFFFHGNISTVTSLPGDKFYRPKYVCTLLSCLHPPATLGSE